MLERPRLPTRCSYLVVPFYIIASLLLTWPLAKNFGSHLPAVITPYDALMHVFLLGCKSVSHAPHVFQTQTVEHYISDLFKRN